LIVTARRLARASPSKPRQADLKRAISTSYYALFQALCEDATDLLVGGGPSRSEEAWVRVYRSLDHGFAKSACREIRNSSLPPTILECARAFVELQEIRHKADYDPRATFTRAEALEWVNQAEVAIAGLRAAPRGDRKAFAVLILIKKRP
jgi:uncharacterized protein (UPF0332 family)